MSKYTSDLTAIALGQFAAFHLLRENEEPLKSEIKKYWKGIAAFPGVGVPWSAVFISFCVKEAGAKASEFKFAAAHAVYFHHAINKPGVFVGRDVADYAPKVGDILQNNRSGNSFDFAHAKKNSEYESHSAIVIEVGADSAGNYLRTIGGNEGDSVGMKEVRLDSKGRVKNSSGLYIAVIETLK